MIHAGGVDYLDAYYGENRVLRLYLGDFLLWEGETGVAVTYTLDGVTASGESTATPGESYTSVLSGATGKQVDPLSVVVTMGGVDITSTAYDWTTNTVTIANVTDAISITAVGVTMDAAYKPLPYIELIDSSAKLPIWTNYYANDATQMEVDVIFPDSSGGFLWGVKGKSASSSSTAADPQYACVPTSGTNKVMRFYRNGKNVTNSDVWARTHLSVNGDVVTYPNTNGGTSTLPANATGTFTCANVLSIFGFSTSANNTYTKGGSILYRWKVKESNTLIHEWVPCERLADGHVGIYDVVANEVVDIKDTTVAQGPATT